MDLVTSLFAFIAIAIELMAVAFIITLIDKKIAPNRIHHECAHGNELFECPDCDQDQDKS